MIQEADAMPPGKGGSAEGRPRCVPARLALHVLTDRAAARGRSEVEIAAAAIAGGATIVQLRGKELPADELLRVGRLLRALTLQAGVLLIVNDHVDLAVAIEADGAHVGQDDLPVPEARRLLGPRRLLGVSARTVEEAVRAAREGADYIGFGPVFPTGSKSDAAPASGVPALRRAVLASAVPVVAIGGITAHTARSVIEAGAVGVAVIAAVVGADDVRDAARALRRAMDQAPARSVG